VADRTPDASSLVASVATVPGYWQLDILWSPLVSTEQTRGAYSLMEQLMPAQAGPPPHVHDHGDELFYILDGELALQLGDQVVDGQPGQLVRIPAGVPHSFAVRSETARVLNFYVPGMLDTQIATLGTPASGPRLPTRADQHPATPAQREAFSQRLHDLATQAPSDQPDLLTRYRSDSPPPLP
jgi:quercetin dioxygenase-like cupin family protein